MNADLNFGLGVGVILIDLKTHDVVKRLAESAVIGKNRSFLFSELSEEYNCATFGWSPNSKQFAFTGTYEGKSGLFVIDIENLSVTLLYEKQNLDVLKWSPEGTKILFFENVNASEPTPDRRFSLYVINLDGTHLVQLTEKPAYFESIVSKWGNDDNTIFLNSWEMKGINLDTMQPNGETLPTADLASLVISSPDHQFDLIVNGNSGKVFLESGDISQKTDMSKNFNVDKRGSPDFQWSPDSKTLAYYGPKEKAILLMSIETLTVSPLVKVAQDDKSQWNEVTYGKYLWLPDSKQIIFTRADGKGGFNVSLVDLLGNVKTLFTAKYPVQLYIEPTKQ
jgi:Tol biopolymer transport system component